MLTKKAGVQWWITWVGTTVVFSVIGSNRAQAVAPATAAIAAQEAAPVVQAAATYAEPIAREAEAFRHLADAGNEAIDPVIFVGRTVMAVPEFARPCRAALMIPKAIIEITHPAKAADDLARIPGDLWAPFGATGGILLDTPRLLGPLRAVGSLGQFVAATVRSAQSLPAGQQGFVPTTIPQAR